MLRLLFLLFLPISLFGQDVNLQFSTLLVPDSLKEGANAIVRSYQEFFTVIDDRTAYKKVRKIVTLLNPKSDEDELVLFYDDDSKITKFKATVYDGLGREVRDIQRKEITDQMAVSGGQFYTDTRVQYVDIEYSEYPYTILFEYEKKLKFFDLVETPRYYPQYYDQSVQKSTLTVEVPLENELLFDAYGITAPEYSMEANKKVYKWRVENLVPIKKEPFAPRSAEVLPNVYTVLKRVELAPGQFADFTTWDNYGKSIGMLYDGKDELPPELVQEVKSLLVNANSDQEKIDLLYNFMQDRVRYVGVQLGIGGWQPFSAAYVEENRYGDCKALSNYMKSLLEVAEIESYPTIIYSGNPRYKAKPDFTSYTFNHVILYVPSEDMYLECTSNYLPTGYISTGTLGQNVLWVTPTGGQLASTPPEDPADHGHLRSQRIKLAEDGTAEVTFETRYVGGPHERWRYLSRELSEKDLKEALQDREQIPDVSGTTFKVVADEEEPFVDLSYATTLPRYARKMGKRFFVPVNRLFPYDARPPKLDSRAQPIVLESGRFLVDSVRIELPEGLNLEAMGETDVNIDHPRGEYQVKSSLDGNVFTWIRTLKLKPVNLPADAYDDLRDFYLAVSKAEKKQLVFKAVTK